MYSSSREEAVAAFDNLDTALNRVLKVSPDDLTIPECLAMLQRCEKIRRRLPAAEHPFINKLADQTDQTELGGKLPFALAERLHISRGEASRRIHEAADLGPRRTLTGQPLPPLLTATAAAQRAGHLGPAHVQVIRCFLHQLPHHVDLPTREKAEAELATLGGRFRPDQLHKLATKLADCLNPDGNYNDTDRARRRSIILGNQGPDGMSAISGYLTPEARATVDAVLAKLAAPGMANPADDTPCLAGTPSQAAIEADTRSAGQRHHDGLLAALRALLCSGELGQHNGLPAAIIVSTSLTELQSRAGHALTGGGTLLPMSDVIRLASHANHYLRIFDHGRELALYHTKRLASPANRPLRQGPRLLVPQLRRTGLSHRGASCDGLRPMPRNRHQRTHPGLRPPPPTGHHRGLDHPQTQRRHHRMASPSPPRPWTTPHQQLLSPRKTPARQRRRRSMSERRNLCVAGEPSDQQPLPLVTVIA